MSAESAAAAFAAEVVHYLRFHVEGRDPSSAARLRGECAQVVARELDVPASPAVASALAEAIVFEPYPDALPALVGLRKRGARLVAASNWDCSLHEVLEETAIAAHLDGAVSSAEAGAAKPDARVFHAALNLVGCSAGDAVHVGDSLEADVRGAAAAGLRAVLLDRDARVRERDIPPHQTIGSLAELLSVI